MYKVIIKNGEIIGTPRSEVVSDSDVISGLEGVTTADIQLVEKEPYYSDSTRKFEFYNEEEIAKQEILREKKRISMLALTKREVFLGLYSALGVTPEQIKSKITDTAGLIEFEYANDYYRGNPLIDMVGTALGINSEQLDKFFDETKKGNENAYKYLTTATLTINAVPAEATVTINNVQSSTITLPYGDTAEYSVAAEGYLTHLGTVELTEDTTLEVELVKEPEEENVNNENDYSQNEGKNVNNEVDNETE